MPHHCHRGERAELGIVTGTHKASVSAAFSKGMEPQAAR